MPAVYPTSIRSFSTKIDLEHTVFALHMNDVQDEITALQVELGTLAKGGFGSVRARLENIEATRSVTTHDHTNRLDTSTHDTTARHTFGPNTAFGDPVTPTAITAGAASTVGTGDNPAKEDHGHAFNTAAIADAIIPAGTIVAYGGTTAPAGWAFCNGAVVTRGNPGDTYNRLYQAIGTRYNTGGETATQFRLPNLQDRFPLGAASTGAAVVAGGTKDSVVVSHVHGNDAHAHGQDAHQHGTYDAGNHEHGTEWFDYAENHPFHIAYRAKGGPFKAGDQGTGWWVSWTSMEQLMTHAGNHSHTTDWRAAGIHGAGIGIHWAGQSGTGMNMPPYQTVNYIIKL